MPGMDWDEVEKRLKAEALAEEIQRQAERDAKMDKAFEASWNDAFEEATGGIPMSEYRKMVESNLPGVTSAEVNEAMKIIAEAQKLKSKGKDAAAISKMSKPVVRKVGKAIKKKKGCVVIVIMLLAVGGSSAAAVIYGAAEAISAMVR